MRLNSKVFFLAIMMLAGIAAGAQAPTTPVELPAMPEEPFWLTGAVARPQIYAVTASPGGGCLNCCLPVTDCTVGIAALAGPTTPEISWVRFLANLNPVAVGDCAALAQGACLDVELRDGHYEVINGTSQPVWQVVAYDLHPEACPK